METPATGNARLLTIKQTAAYLGSTIWFVRSLAWERRVSHLRLGKRIVFDIADLDAFVAAQKIAAH